MRNPGEYHFFFFLRNGPWKKIMWRKDRYCSGKVGRKEQELKGFSDLEVMDNCE